MSVPFTTDRFLASLLAGMSPTMPSGMRERVSNRFQQHFPVLYQDLQHLYAKKFADEHAFALWLMDLLCMAGNSIAQRPALLLELDQQRSEDREWFTKENMLGYCCYVDRFAGDLKGVQQRIPHLQELGVTYLHLLPFLKARAGENDGGFAVADFDAIEPRFGTMQDLEQTCDALRKAGISLCSDFILNHVADDHPWAIAAKNGDARYRDYFYHYPDRSEPDAFEKHLGQVFPQVAPGNFSYVLDIQAWVWTTFYPYQWDLNYRNPAVFADMTAALLRLANRGVEAFRLDSTAFLWKRAGTKCMNQPEAHQILQALRSLVDIAAPGVLLKAEAIVETSDLPAYLGSNDETRIIKECHLAYHSSLMAASWVALAEQDTSLIRHVVAATPALPEQSSWLTYVRCHDDIGWNVLRPEACLEAEDVQQRLARVSRFYSGEDSYARGQSFQATDPGAVHGTVGMASALTGFTSAQTAEEKYLARQRLLLLYGLSFCFGGMPLIYMGDELAQENDAAYQHITAQAVDSRWLHRPAWDENLYQQRHDSLSHTAAVFDALCHMLHVRRQLLQLAAATPRQLLTPASPAVLAFMRGSTKQPLLYLANFSENNVSIDINALLAGYDIPAQAWLNQLDRLDAGTCVTLTAYAQLWLTQKNNPGAKA
ncbi:alpha-amylase family glycosyl hydrolase [Undibacterium sp. Di26W]|uniref:alpha-amylase family glycosyl hydrolase n=1 Tax=Undibacterium sp. Di26W TaxID=3413035 RepID=UPI003BF20D57